MQPTMRDEEDCIDEDGHTLPVGDEVQFQLNGKVVGKFIVDKVGRCVLCHDNTLQHGCAKVYIMGVFNGNASLPYPHSFFESLLDSLKSWEVWDIKDLICVPSMVRLQYSFLYSLMRPFNFFECNNIGSNHLMLLFMW